MTMASALASAHTTATRLAWESYRTHWNWRLRDDRVCIASAVRSDDYVFFLIYRSEKRDYVVFAGCRHALSIKEYRRHVKLNYRRGAAWKRRETLAILDLFANAVKRHIP